jgi:hypothetical protein
MLENVCIPDKHVKSRRKKHVEQSGAFARAERSAAGYL